MKFSGSPPLRSNPPFTPVKDEVVLMKFARPPTSPFARNAFVVERPRSAMDPVRTLPFTMVVPTIHGAGARGQPLAPVTLSPLSNLSKSGASPVGPGPPLRVRLNASRIPFSKIFVSLSCVGLKSFVALLPTQLTSSVRFCASSR